MDNGGQNSPTIEARLLLKEAQAALDRGDAASAYQSACRLVDLDPTNVAAWWLRVTTTDDVDDAVESLHWVLINQPGHMEARRRLWQLRGTSPLTRVVSASRPPMPEGNAASEQALAATPRAESLASLLAEMTEFVPPEIGLLAPEESVGQGLGPARPGADNAVLDSSEGHPIDDERAPSHADAVEASWPSGASISEALAEAPQDFLSTMRAALLSTDVEEFTAPDEPETTTAELNAVSPPSAPVAPPDPAADNEETWRSRATTATDPFDVAWAYVGWLRLQPDNHQVREDLLGALQSLTGPALEPAYGEELLVAHLAELVEPMMAEGWTDLAYLLVTRLTDLRPELEEAWLYRARSAPSLAERLESIQRALLLNPRSSTALLDLERITGALTDAQPSDVQPMMALAQALVRNDPRQNQRQAYQLFRRVVELQADQIEAWLGCAETTGDLDERSECFRRVLELEPRNPQALAGAEELEHIIAAQQARQETEKLLNDGLRALAIGQREVAYALLKKATALNPQIDRAWLALAEATADPEEALGYLEKALSLNPEDRQTQLAYETTRVQTLRKSADQMAEQIRAETKQHVQARVKTAGKTRALLRRLAVWLMQPTGWRLGWWDRYHKALVALILVLALFDLGGFWLYSAANEPPVPTARTAPIGVPAEDASSGDNPPTPFPTMTPFVFAGRLTPTPLPANLANGVFRPLGPPEVNVRKVVAAKNALFIVTLTGGGDLLRYSSEPDGWQSLKENVSTFAAATSLLAVDSLTAAFYHVAQLETPLLEWSLDNGQTWEDIREVDFVAGINHLSVVPTDTLYFSSDLGRVYRSQDSGLSWHLVSVETGQYRGLVAHIVPFAARPEVVYVVYDSGRIYRSTGDVNTWGEAGYSFEGREKLVSVLVDSQAANLLYALDQAGRVYYSVDSARTWIPLRASNPAEGQPVALLMDPVDHLTLFLIFQKEVFVSPNRGRDWQRLPLPAGTTVTAADIREGTLALGTTAGLLVYGNYR